MKAALRKLDQLEDIVHRWADRWPDDVEVPFGWRSDPPPPSGLPRPVPVVTAVMVFHRGEMLPSELRLPDDRSWCDRVPWLFGDGREPAPSKPRGEPLLTFERLYLGDDYPDRIAESLRTVFADVPSFTDPVRIVGGAPPDRAPTVDELSAMQRLLGQVPIELRNDDLPGCWWPASAWQMWDPTSWRP
jgi:hypothetical protein